MACLIVIKRQRCVFLVLQGCSTGGPGTQLSAGWWLSLVHLSPTGLQNSIGGPKGHSGRGWLSLPHLVSDVSDPQLIRGPKDPAVGLSLPHLISNFSGPQLTDFLSSQSYIIVQRPLNRPLNLWNGMFDRHQTEITVMQFRGHSLPVHQSMSVSWAFTLSHFVSQIRLRDVFWLLAIGMCHFLLVHHFGMACLAGSKVKIQ